MKLNMKKGKFLKQTRFNHQRETLNQRKVKKLTHALKKLKTERDELKQVTETVLEHILRLYRGK